jgi:hypothetical protein
MKKILLAFDGKHFPENAFDFGRMLNEKEPIVLTSILLPEAVPSGILNYAYGSDFPVYTPLM